MVMDICGTVKQVQQKFQEGWSEYLSITGQGISGERWRSPSPVLSAGNHEPRGAAEDWRTSQSKWTAE